MQPIIVIGGGISGLATAYEIREKVHACDLDADVTLLEAEERPGGKICSEKTGGFLVEWGPNGFLDSKPSTLDLCRRLALESDLLPSSDAARKRFVFAEGRLHQLPESPPAFLKSQIMSGKGKARLLLEPLVKRSPAFADESLADFARRRLGAEALERLIGPMASGVFAGDPERMSLKSCFPRIHELEQEYGGLFKAMLHLARQKKKAGGKSSGPAGPGGRLTSFAGGMEDMVQRLHESLGERLQSGMKVEAIEVEGVGREQSFRLKVAGKRKRLEAHRLVLAVPAYVAAELLAPLDGLMSAAAREIPYAPVAVVALGWRREQVKHSLDGFGFLVPRGERRSILGSLWTSSIFPGCRAPEGYVMTRNMVGGMTRPELFALSDEELLKAVLGDLDPVLETRSGPEFVKIIRWERAIPQYTPGHSLRLARIAARLHAFPNLFLTGNAYKGVGINDCTANAAETAAEVTASLQRPSLSEA